MRTKRIGIIAAVAVLVAAFAASSAVASPYPGYALSQRQASINAMQVAEAIYKTQHVIAISAKCTPQKGQHKVAGKGGVGPKYHRWVCAWRGISMPVDAAGNPDPNGIGKPVTGKVIIAGNNGNYFTYWVQQGLRFV